jgi:hypothetical protein
MTVEFVVFKTRLLPPFLLPLLLYHAHKHCFGVQTGHAGQQVSALYRASSNSHSQHCEDPTWVCLCLMICQHNHIVALGQQPFYSVKDVQIEDC